METTSTDPKELFAQCEKVIAAASREFLVIGGALDTIRNHKLFKLSGFDSFERYSQSRWNFSRQYASNLVIAFNVEKELSTVVDRPVLENERQARKYRCLEDTEKQTVIDSLKAGSTMTEALAPFRRQNEENGGEKKEKKSDKVQVLDAVDKIRSIVDRNGQNEQVYEALIEIQTWAKTLDDTEEPPAAKMPEDQKEDDWMKDTQEQFPIKEAA